ncbi:hypothetical protein ACFFX0_30075, partial [Citricoccus parietis]
GVDSRSGQHVLQGVSAPGRARPRHRPLIRRIPFPPGPSRTDSRRAALRFGLDRTSYKAGAPACPRHSHAVGSRRRQSSSLKILWLQF